MKKEIKTSSKKTNNIDSNLDITNNTTSTKRSTPDFSVLLQNAKTFYNEILNTLKALENYFTEQYNLIRLNFTKATSFISQLKQNSTILVNNSFTLKEAVKKETNIIKSNIEALKKSLQKETEKTLLLKHNKNRYLETIAFNKTENTIITMNIKHLKTKIEINKKNLNELNNKIISSKNDNQMYVSKEYSINNLTYEASLRIKKLEEDNLEIKKEIERKGQILREKKKEYEDKNQIVVHVFKENEEIKRNILSEIKNLKIFDNPNGNKEDKNKGSSCKSCMDNTVGRSNKDNNFLDNFCSFDALKDEFNSIRDFQSTKIDNYLLNVSKEFEFYKNKTGLLLELYNSIYTNNISDKNFTNTASTIKERLEYSILACLTNLNINNYNLNNYYTNNYGNTNNYNNNDKMVLNDLNTKLIDLKQENDFLENEYAMKKQNNQDLNSEKKTKQEEVYFLAKSHYNKALINRVFKSFNKLINDTANDNNYYENNDNKNNNNNFQTQNCSVFKSKKHNKSSSRIKNKSFVIEDESILGESKIKLNNNYINKTTGNDREIKLVSVLKKPKDQDNFYSDSNNNTNNISNIKTNDISINKSNKQLKDNKQNKKDLIDDIKYINYNDSSQLISGLLTSNNKQHPYRNINLNKLNEDSGNNNKDNDNKTQKRVSFNIPEDTNTKNSYNNIKELNNSNLSQYININDVNDLDNNNTNNNSSVLKLNNKKKKKKGKSTLSGNNNTSLNGNSNNNNGYSNFFDMNILKEVTRNINDVERDEKSNLKKLMNKYLY